MAEAYPKICNLEDPSDCAEIRKSIPSHDLAILLVGATGSGKSSFANFMSGTTHFPVGKGPQSKTQISSFLVNKVLEIDLMIIDAPGFMDNVQGDDKVFDELCKANLWASEGVTAVVIVIDLFNRTNPLLKSYLDDLAELGGDFWNYAFIIFPKEKKMLKELECESNGLGRDYIEKFKGTYPEDLLYIMNKVNNRYICEESKSDIISMDNYKTNKKNEIIAMIRQMSTDTEGQCKMYSNEMMRIGITYIRKLRKNNDKQENLQAHIIKLQAQIIANSENANASKEACLNLKNELDSKKNEMEELVKSHAKEINSYKALIKNLMERIPKPSSCTIL